MRPALPLAAVLPALLAAGCATLVNGSRQEVPLEVEPRGATVVVYPERTRHTAPTVLDLDRKQVHTLLVEHPGYRSERVYLNRLASPWIFGDFVFIVFPAALWIDTSSGGAYVLRPSVVKLVLQKLPEE